MKQIKHLLPYILGLFTWINANSQTPKLFKDLNTGTVTSVPAGFYNAGNHMYFIARVGPKMIHQLWKTDGTESNTIMLKDSLIYDNNRGDLINIRAHIGDIVYFTKSNDPSTTTNKTELWKTDGTKNGTVLITTLSHMEGSGGGGAPRNFTAGGNKIFFSMGKNNGRELWVSDGTAAGTFEVIDLAPGKMNNFAIGGVSDLPMIGYKDKVYFQGSDAPANFELWSSDGTAAGTKLVKEINPGTGTSFGSYPGTFKVYKDELFFFADDNSAGTNKGIWKTDGTNTIKLAGTAFANSQPTIFKDELYFINGISLWKTDGTVAGTKMVVDSTASIKGVTNNRMVTVYLKYKTTAPYYDYFYNSFDGTGNTTVSYNAGNSASFNVINNKMYICRLDSGSWTAYGLWESDGTEAGTKKLLEKSMLVHVFKDAIYFPDYDAATGTELWRIEFTPAASVKKNNINSAAKNIYPNPGAGIFNINTGDVKIQSLKVLDISGRVVYSQQHFNNTSSSINLTHLLKGTYIIQVRTTNYINTQKVIIQ